MNQLLQRTLIITPYKLMSINCNCLEQWPRVFLHKLSLQLTQRKFTKKLINWNIVVIGLDAFLSINTIMGLEYLGREAHS